MKHIKIFLAWCQKHQVIINTLEQEGGTCYLVGGAVRDLVLGLLVKDYDIEVHGLTSAQLEVLLERFGFVSLVGKQFGVFRIHGIEIDWSLPRRDSLGRKPLVIIDSSMSLPEALRRRDVTMNAMAVNLTALLKKSHAALLAQVQDAKKIAQSLDVIDPYGGLHDMKMSVLRAVDAQLFTQDPLRFFRVMHFIGRFSYWPDDQLNEICRTMTLCDSETKIPLARERIFEELKKLLLLSTRPSRGFRWLVELGRLAELFPELAALCGVPQWSDYHPEGDVFEHTMQALDAAAQLPQAYFIVDGQDSERVKQTNRLAVILGALCHDLGKPMTTDEALHAFDHDKVGAEIARKFLRKITDELTLITMVCTLVRYHMRPFALVHEQAHARAYKRLAFKLGPHVPLRLLGLVSLADVRGRNPASSEPLAMAGQHEFDVFIARAEQASVVHRPEEPVLQGRDLLDIVKTGPMIGALLKEAYRIQLDEGITDPVILKKRVLENTKK